MRPTFENLIIRPALGLLWHQLYDEMDRVGHHRIAANFDGKKDRLNLWTHAVAERRGVPKASVALAARPARLAWTLMQKITLYQPRF